MISSRGTREGIAEAVTVEGGSRSTILMEYYLELLLRLI